MIHVCRIVQARNFERFIGRTWLLLFALIRATLLNEHPFSKRRDLQYISLSWNTKQIYWLPRQRLCPLSFQRGRYERSRCEFREWRHRICPPCLLLYSFGAAADTCWKEPRYRTAVSDAIIQIIDWWKAPSCTVAESAILTCATSTRKRWRCLNSSRWFLRCCYCATPFIEVLRAVIGSLVSFLRTKFLGHVTEPCSWNMFLGYVLEIINTEIQFTCILGCEFKFSDVFRIWVQ